MLNYRAHKERGREIFKKSNSSTQYHLNLNKSQRIGKPFYWLHTKEASGLQLDQYPKEKGNPLKLKERYTQLWPVNYFQKERVKCCNYQFSHSGLCPCTCAIYSPSTVVMSGALCGNGLHDDMVCIHHLLIHTHFIAEVGNWTCLSLRYACTECLSTTFSTGFSARGGTLTQKVPLTTMLSYLFL